MSEETQQFPKFALGVSRGLMQAVLTDSEVLSLATAGLLLGSRSRRARGLGIALGTLVLARRADQYVTVIDSNLQRLVRVISASNIPSSETNG